MDCHCKSANIRVKYAPNQNKRLFHDGDWVDVFANETVFIPQGMNAMVNLGICIELPKHTEAIVAPRSSTFKHWGVVLCNDIGIIDESYNGDTDWWMLNLFCLKGLTRNELGIIGSYIKKGDKIAQFRIQKKMPKLEFEEVETLNNEDRGGFGTKGTE